MSAVLPGQHQVRIRMPVRMTAIPITTCGKSSRKSLEWRVGPGPAAAGPAGACRRLPARPRPRLRRTGVRVVPVAGRTVRCWTGCAGWASTSWSAAACAGAAVTRRRWSGCCSRWSRTAPAIRGRSWPRPAGWSRSRTCHGLAALDEDAAYRAMDLLLEIEDTLAEQVFWATATLLDLEVDLVFSDSTSTYFERDTADVPAARDRHPSGCRRRQPGGGRAHRFQGTATATGSTGPARHGRAGPPAEAVQHLRDRVPRLRMPHVVRQLHIPDLRPPRDRPQVHTCRRSSRTSVSRRTRRKPYAHTVSGLEQPYPDRRPSHQHKRSRAYPAKIAQLRNSGRAPQRPLATSPRKTLSR